MLKKFRTQLIKFVVTAFVFAALVGCASSSATGSKKRNSTPLKIDSSIESGKLSNGMKFYVQKNTEPKNRIYLRLVVKAGSCMEEDDQRGVAHFVEHMCFNGTEHFAKNDLINYLESTGMQFGPEVNAETIFEQTTYMLEIPADDPEILAKAMLVLHDWASAVTFNQEDLDADRGVVVEEWRARMQSLSGRMLNQYVPAVFKGSRFEDRLPIGDMDIIRNVSRDRVVDFYNKWYRPDNMTVVLVGDAETSTMKAAIKTAMESIPARKDKFEHPDYVVQNHTGANIVMMPDKEMPYPIVEVYHQSNDEASTTEWHQNEYFKTLLLSGVMNERLAAITNSAKSPWLVAQASGTNLSNMNSLRGLVCVPKDGQFEEAFKLLMDEADRMVAFGPTEDEIARQKTNLLTGAEQNYNARESISSASKAGSLVSYVTQGHVPLSAEEYLKLVKKLLPSVTKEDVQNTAKEIFADRGDFLFAEFPEGRKDLPNEAELKELWKNYKNEEITAYEEAAGGMGLGERPATKAEVISTKKLAELDTTVYELSNGAKLIFKKTDFDKNSVLFQAFSKGGFSKYSQKDILSARYASDWAMRSGINGLNYSQVIKELTGKNLSINGLNMTSYTETISGNFAPEFTEDFLSFLYQMTAHPQFDDDVWETLMTEAKTFADSRDAQPMNVLNNTINELIFGKDLRYVAARPEDLKNMNKDRAREIYLETAQNAADFTYMFVGDFDEKQLLELCQYYIGSLPGNKNKLDTVKFNEKAFPKGNKREVIKKGVGNQSAVFIAMGGEKPAGTDLTQYWVDGEITWPLSSLLSIKLREEIRERLGGTYGISASVSGIGCGDMSQKSAYISQFFFQCEPERAVELSDAVIATLKELAENPVDDETLGKILEEYKRGKESNLRSNSWWLSELQLALVQGTEPVSSLNDYNTIPSQLTKENIQKLVKKYCDTSDYMRVILLPE